jgi:hypothetical protein
MATEEADWRIVAIVGVIEMDELNGRKLDGIAGKPVASFFGRQLTVLQTHQPGNSQSEPFLQ